MAVTISLYLKRILEKKSPHSLTDTHRHTHTDRLVNVVRQAVAISISVVASIARSDHATTITFGVLQNSSKASLSLDRILCTFPPSLDPPNVVSISIVHL